MYWEIVDYIATSVHLQRIFTSLCGHTILRSMLQHSSGSLRPLNRNWSWNEQNTRGLVAALTLTTSWYILTCTCMHACMRMYNVCLS